uniref:Putative secreted protein n=1 Tax=Ixodes ricinus TaxID=34613 RepID=A0A6B0UWX2_IXORI
MKLFFLLCEVGVLILITKVPARKDFLSTKKRANPRDRRAIGLSNFSKHKSPELEHDNLALLVRKIGKGFTRMVTRSCGSGHRCYTRHIFGFPLGFKIAATWKEEKQKILNCSLRTTYEMAQRAGEFCQSFEMGLCDHQPQDESLVLRGNRDTDCTSN